MRSIFLHCFVIIVFADTTYHPDKTQILIILLLDDSVVIESDSSHIPGHYQSLKQYSVTRSH